MLARLPVCAARYHWIVLSTSRDVMTDLRLILIRERRTCLGWACVLPGLTAVELPSA